MKITADPPVLSELTFTVKISEVSPWEYSAILQRADILRREFERVVHDELLDAHAALEAAVKE